MDNRGERKQDVRAAPSGRASVALGRVAVLAAVNADVGRDRSYGPVRRFSKKRGRIG